MKKKYSELDLIEKHRVLLWARIRDRLLHHLEHIEGKLEPYDMQSIQAASQHPDTNAPNMQELDSFLERMQKNS